MKKHLLLPLILLTVVSLFCSCMTSLTPKQVKVEYTQKEANEAMTVAITKAVKNSNTRFFQKLSTYSFLPAEYNVAEENKTSIPGMVGLIDSWNSYVSSYLEANRDSFEKQTNEIANSLKITNGDLLVKSSNKSGTKLMEESCKQQLLDFIKNLVEGMDFSRLTSVKKQYNAWIISENSLNGTSNSQLVEIDAKDALVKMIYNTYVGMVSMYEELIRTTPDPYAEEILVKVFGIR